MSARRPAVARAACHCSNIDIMQLFHELKQQFPAVPDELVSACISDHCHDRPACCARLQRELDARPRALAYPPALMGAPARPRHHTHQHVHDVNDEDNDQQTPVQPEPSSAPSSLVLPSSSSASSPASSSLSSPYRKPPTLPRQVVLSPTSAAPPPPTSQPPQRPTTLELPAVARPASVNLSVKVDCSLGVSPVRRTSVLHVTPDTPWARGVTAAAPVPGTPGSSSPRTCYTSVNLTLRTPTSSSQVPIDICSHSSSLTYSTSSFDRRQGTQSELRITVGPAGLNSVSAVRTRLPPLQHQPPLISLHNVHTHAGAAANTTTSTFVSPSFATDTKQHLVLVSRQLERKGQLETELAASKARLKALSKEVATLRLENTAEFRDKLRRQIRHLRSQCERLTREVDSHLDLTGDSGAPRAHTGGEEARWPCGLCTFRNHPLLSRCEQCDMPRLLLVSAEPGENIHIRFSPGNSTRKRYVHANITSVQERGMDGDF